MSVIAVRTPTGVRVHIAPCKWGRPVGPLPRTFCGRVFDAGVDTVEAYDETTHDPVLCSSCTAARTRRARRAEGIAILEGPDPTKPATPPWAPRATTPARRLLIEDLSPALIIQLRKDRDRAPA